MKTTVLSLFQKCWAANGIKLVGSTQRLLSTSATISSSSTTNKTSTSTVPRSTNKKKICIVGAGPAGFYAAQYLVKHLDDAEIDIVEKLPVPFGLVRYANAHTEYCIQRAEH